MTATPERRLFQAIIVRALADAAGPDERDRAEVAAWLASDDFV
jgi:hypothetical protein